MGKEVIVIGGGVIGLCSAYYLQKEGHQVTIVDQSDLNTGASYVNAGFISPSHIIPLSAPGVMKKGLKWMFNSSSPLYIKPRLNTDFLKWVWAFNKSCNTKHVQKSIPVIKNITLLSQELFDDIKRDEHFKFHYDKKGLLMLCQTAKGLEEEVKVANNAKSEGLDAKEISLEELKKLEPNIKINTIGGTYYKCDSHTTPQEFMEEMKAHLRNLGVTYLSNEKVVDIQFNNDIISSIKTNKQTLAGDEIILAAGSWSDYLSKKIGLNLLLQAGKGYRIDSRKNTGISVPTILAEAKVAITPMHGFTRFAGTMEISGINHIINNARVEAIAKAAGQYYPNVVLTKQEKQNASCGLRPVSPDGLPYIGKSKKCNNLTIATGHAMMGWSMAPATGKLISEIIAKKKPSLNLDSLHPDRKF